MGKNKQFSYVKEYQIMDVNISILKEVEHTPHS